MVKSPPISKDLLDYLGAIFKDSLPDSLLGMDEMARLVGRQDVIRRLRQEYVKQNRNILAD